jgi:hypothetical protein
MSRSIVIDHKSAPITVQNMIELQHFLSDLQARGNALGPVLSFCAVARADRNSSDIEDIAVEGPTDFFNAAETYGTFFNLDSTSARGFYDSNINALLHHHARSARLHDYHYLSDNEDSANEFTMCGRCNSACHKKVFRTCRTVVHNGQRLLRGTCTNCTYNGASGVCSMTCE